MIVCDLGDAWQVVMQPDHAELSGQLAARWGNDEFAVPNPLASVQRASRRHDDGWAVWERSPQLDPTGAPCNFINVHIPSHLAFWRAGTAAVEEEDPYAGLLVSMHGAGIYRMRYGTQPEMKMAFAGQVKDLVDAFVAEQEGSYGARRGALGASEPDVQANYRLLQVFDRLSLAFCMADAESPGGATITSVPRDYEGGETDLTISPAGPFRATLDPYPFAVDEAFTLRRRIVPKGSWESGDEFRETLSAMDPEVVRIEMAPARVPSG
ncbi:MAG: hypothetical protein QOH46_213 [Solirubrobacteraceae bacterium]|nr:hypothetical protein [Solirubrobacteraceae bacterium]